jgi:hypothetical protein
VSDHTPGPWIVEEHRATWTSYIVRGGPKQNKIAQCFNWQDNGFDVSSEENARLIAAAPNMLEALEAADEALSLIETVGHGARMDNVSVARGIVLKAIAKAKGGAV